MKNRGSFLSFLSESSADPDTVAVFPIVELAGDRRVLVENHFGVIYYTNEKIGIKVKYGELQICGCGLNLQHMTKIKLVVTGQIDGITIFRRRVP